MSQYSPIRDAFNDLNKLIYDKERFAAEQDQIKSNHEERMMGLQSQMAQQKFNNDLNIKQFKLSQAGQEQAANQFQQTMDETKARNAESDRRWKAGQATREETEKQIKLNNALAQEKLNAIQRENAPRLFTPAQAAFGNQEYMQNPKWQQTTLAVLDPTGEQGLHFKGKVFLDKDNRPFKPTPQQIALYQPLLEANNQNYDQSPAKWHQAALETQGRVNALTTRKKQLESSYSLMDKIARAHVKAQLAEENSKLEQAKQKLSPSNMVGYYDKQRQVARNAASIYAASGNAAMAQARTTEANKALDAQAKILTKLYGATPTEDMQVKQIYYNPNATEAVNYNGKRVEPGQNLGVVYIDRNNPQSGYILNGVRYPDLPDGVVMEDNLKSTVSGTGSGSGKLPAGTMTEKQMLSFPELAKEDMMGKMVYADTVKPQLNTLRSSTNAVFDKMFKGDPAGRRKAQDFVRTNDRKLQTQYFKDMKALNEMSPKDTITLLRKLKKSGQFKGKIPSGTAKRKLALKGYGLRKWKEMYRNTMGVADLQVYQPNEAAFRSQLTGLQKY